MDIGDRLQTENDEFIQLCGKQIELTKEKDRINRHRYVFLAELGRLDTELSTVSRNLDEVNHQRKMCERRLMWLRMQRFLHILYKCIFYAYTFITFVLINALYMTYVALMVAANLARVILENISTSSTNTAKLEETVGWT